MHPRTHAPTTATMCVCEVRWTDAEWKEICDRNRGDDASDEEEYQYPPIPRLLQEIIPRDEWSTQNFKDYKDFEQQNRKFIMVDGNHRVWCLQMLRV